MGIEAENVAPGKVALGAAQCRAPIQRGTSSQSQTVVIDDAFR
jgi:hypothetical protein